MLCMLLWACGESAVSPSTTPTNPTTSTTSPATEPPATEPPATEPPVTGPSECAHNYQISENIPSSCLQAGVLKYTCANCGHSYQTELPLAEHMFAEATCSEPKICTICKRSEGTPLGHNYVTAETVQPTCATAGHTKYACSRCNDSYTTRIPVIPHSYAQATCTKPQTCAVCGHTNGTALGHNYQITKQVSATCTAKGYTQHTCSRCADTYQDKIPMLPHNFSAATCTQPQTCATCGATKGNALTHNYVNNICSRCNSIYSNFEIPLGGYDGSEVTITFYHTMGYALQDILDAYIADFNRLYPNIRILHQQVGNYDDVRDQINLELAFGESGPNIAYCYPDHVAIYNQFGSVVNLDGLIGSTIQFTNVWGETEILGLTPDQLSDFIPGFFDEGRQFGDNLMYSLPLSKSTEVLYYDKTFFEANGLKVPTTWDELEALCAKILQIDPTCIPFAYDEESNWFINMCAQSGSDYTSATGSHYLFNNTANRDFAARIRQWYQLGYCTTMEIYGGYSSALFTAQSGTRCYMSIGSSGGAVYNLPRTEWGDYAFEVGVASIPQVAPAKPKVISQGPSLCLFQSENPQEVIASWLFMKFLTTNVPFQAEFSMDSGYMPVIQSVVSNPIYANFLSRANGYSNIAARVIQVCLAQQNAYFTSPAFVGSSSARDAVGDLLVRVMTYHDGGNATDLISQLFANAVNICIDPTTPPISDPGAPLPPSGPQLPTSDRIVIRYLADDLYATGTEYFYTSGNGSTKLELELSYYKSGAQIFTLVKNSDGTVSFRLDNGSYLYCNANDVTFSYQQSDYTKFVLEEAENGWFIRCAVANYNGKPQYLEVYGGYLTCYGMGTNESMYIFHLENAN